jgi:hypothetical protein
VSGDAARPPTPAAPRSSSAARHPPTRPSDRLSELDDHALPHGECLIGELEGRVVAALDVGSGEAIADPFVATAALVELLGLRAAQVRR